MILKILWGQTLFLSALPLSTVCSSQNRVFRPYLKISLIFIFSTYLTPTSLTNFETFSGIMYPTSVTGITLIKTKIENHKNIFFKKLKKKKITIAFISIRASTSRENWRVTISRDDCRRSSWLKFTAILGQDSGTLRMTRRQFECI